jgi:phosphoglycolate phosphatase-like HAD superfamily hydrolase
MTFDPTRVRALIFDIDGTLCDTDDQWVDALARRLMHLRVRDPRHVARRIVTEIEAPGNGVLALLDRLGLDGPFVRSADWLHRFRWRDKPGKFRLVPGVMDMIGALHPHYPLAICSARNGATVNAFLHQFELDDAFVCVASALTTRRTKPHPDPLLWCAHRLGVPPEHCAMVGDTTVDMRAGRAAGMQSIGVLCGFGERAELERAGAHIVLQSSADVGGLLARMGM